MKLKAIAMLAAWVALLTVEGAPVSAQFINGRPVATPNAGAYLPQGGYPGMPPVAPGMQPNVHPGVQSGYGAMGGDYGYPPVTQAAFQQPEILAPPQPPFAQQSAPIDGVVDGAGPVCSQCGGAPCQACGGCNHCGHYQGCHLCPGNYSCVPLWRMRLDALSLRRNIHGDMTFSNRATTAGLQSVLSTGGNLHFNNQTNFRIELERRLEENASLEFVYFGLQNWSDSAGIRDSLPDLQSPYFLYGTSNGPAFGYDAAFAHTISYSTRFHNAEINYWRPIPYALHGLHASFLAGVRFFNLHEGFTYAGFTPNFVGQTNIQTRNNMVGSQIGFQLTAPIKEKFSIRWDGKAGIFLNSAEQRTVITRYNNALGVRDINYAEAVNKIGPAFVGEVNIVGAYRLNCRWTLYAGYQMLWVESLALAPNNFNPNFPTSTGRPGTQTIDNDGRAFYQGARGGFQFTW